MSRPAEPLQPHGVSDSSRPERIRRQAGEGFWRRRWVQNILPLGTSLVLHLAIILVGYATFKTVQRIVNVPHEKPQPYVPTFDLPQETPFANQSPFKARITDPGGPLGGLPDWNSPFAGPSNVKRSSEAMDVGDIPATMISVGPNSSTGQGKLTGPFSDQPGAYHLGVPGGGDGTPGAGIGQTFGVGHRVVFLCDASGSMVGVFGQLKVELKHSIEKLKASQSFDVIFFSDADISAFSKTDLVFANPENKRKAYEFIDNAVAHGGTQPLPAIHFAMSLRPELTFVLTDGFDQISNFDDVINAFHKGNQDQHMTVNCIFLEADEDPRLVEVLKKIAHDNRGMMRTIRKSDF